MGIAKWTLMVYMAGFNSLSRFSIADLNEMRKVGSNDDVRVCIFVKNKVAPVAQRFVLQKDPSSEVVESLPSADSGRAQTLIDFIRWAVHTAPAMRYGLVIWNHGGGWRPEDLDALYEEVKSRELSLNLGRRELPMLAGSVLSKLVFRESAEAILSLPGSDERAIASDDGSGHSLDTIELRHVLEKAMDEIGAPLELLGMDACLMSNFEVSYETSSLVKYVVGSEDVEPGDGWPYSEILGALGSTPDLDGAGLGRVIVEKYVASYSEGPASATQCVVNQTRIQSVAAAIDSLGHALGAILSDRNRQFELVQAHKACAHFNGELVDLKSFCAAVQTHVESDMVRTAADTVLRELEPVGYVESEGHRGEKVDGCGGVTIYLPSPMDNVSRFYGDLRVAKETAWADFIGSYTQSFN